MSFTSTIPLHSLEAALVGRQISKVVKMFFDERMYGVL